ncbi:MAG: hypothetical protein NTW14_04275 [bacterium]|nr:hypothetical protein [bacterium]
MRSKLSYTFLGAPGDSELNTLLISLQSFQTIVKETTTEITGDGFSTIKVKEINIGSYNFFFEFNTFFSAPPMIEFGIKLTAAIIPTIIIELYKLKKFHSKNKNLKIEKGEKTTQIVNSGGETLIINNPTYNIYQNNPSIKRALNSNISAINQDTSIAGIRIEEPDQGNSIEITREELPALIEDEISESEESRPVVADNCILTVFKVVFDLDDKRYKWGFLYKEKKIEARIEDEKFSQTVAKGEKFSKGDTLNVRLEILQKFDKNYGEYLDNSFKILEVYNHKSIGDQMSINE